MRKLAKCKIKSLKSRKKKATLKWGKVKDAYWYEVCFSTKRNAGKEAYGVARYELYDAKTKKEKFIILKSALTDIRETDRRRLTARMECGEKSKDKVMDNKVFSHCF